MKVLHIVDSFSTLSETFIYDYITELERQGVDNHVFTFYQVNQEERPFTKVYAAETRKNLIWFILRAIAQFNNKPDKWWALKRREINKIVKMLKPDIIHAHFGPMGVLTMGISMKYRIPLVTTFYGYDASTLLKETFWIELYKYLWNNVSAITVLSKQMKETLHATGLSNYKINVIHLSRNTKYFKIKDIPQKINNFISVGRLTEKKGHLDTIKAVKEVIKKGCSITLKIIGDGPLKDMLQRFIDHNNLNNNIKLLGAVNNDDTIKELYGADAFILCSKTAKDGDMEGTPTVLVEAQAIGLPCISTYHAGIPEMIPEENHKLLAEEGNVLQIKELITNLINTEEDELKIIVERSRKKIEEEFNLEIEVKKLVDVYNKISVTK